MRGPLILLAVVCLSAVVSASGLKTEERFLTTTGPSCGFCKGLVKETFKFLRENRTEETVRDALDKICTLVYPPGSARLNECEHFIATYTRELVEILVDETDPELICMLLGQCNYEVKKQTVIVDAKPTILTKPDEDEDETSPSSPPSSQDVALSEFISLLDPSIATGSARTCIECKLFISYLQNTVQDPKSQDEIKDWLLKNLCESLEKDDLKNSCRNMVNTNAKAFFEAVAAQLDPKATCVEFGACRRGVMLIDNMLRKPSVRSEVPIKVQDPTPLSDKFFKAIEAMLDPMEKWMQSESAVVQEKPSVPIETIQPTVEDEKSSKSSDSMLTRPLLLINNEKGVLCDQCVQIVTKLDEYISSHSIDHDVDVLVDQVCNKIPQDSVRQQCTLLVKTFGADIINAISTMKNPQELCSSIMLC